jgi:hypothetical protein
LLALSACRSLLPVFTDRQTHTPAFLTPFEVIRAFWMSPLLAVDENQIRLDATVGGKDDWAVPHALKGLDAFGKGYFFGLRVGYWRHLRFNSESA